MKNAEKKQKKNGRRTHYFANEIDARDDALREKNLEDRLGNLYALQERFPEDIDIEQEIEELEIELRN